MTKIIFSIVTLLLLLQGCNNSSSKTSVSTTKVSEEIKSFVLTFKESKSIGNSVGKNSSSALQSSSLNKQVQKETLQSCENGGTKKITTDVDFENVSQEDTLSLFSNGFSITMDSDNCIENGEKVDASMTMFLKLTNEFMTMTMKFNRDSTFEDLETTEIITITKDSNMNIKEISESEEVLTESMKVSSSQGKSYESIALISHEISGNSTDSFYEVSGKRLNNGISYSVDTNYDASKTPMVIEYESGDLLSGTAKYFNDNNEYITMKVIERNKIKISVDSNNDGIDDAEETIDL